MEQGKAINEELAPARKDYHEAVVKFLTPQQVADGCIPPAPGGGRRVDGVADVVDRRRCHPDASGASGGTALRCEATDEGMILRSLRSHQDD